MSGTQWKILLIEDDEDDFFLTRLMLLESIGNDFHLEWASDYATGLDLCSRNNWDVVILDYMIGKYNGIELARDAIARGLQSPIILLTGKGSYRVDLAAMRAGVMDYLVKGHVSAPVLERAIRYAIERYQARKALEETQNLLEERVQDRTRELEQANTVLRNEVIERQKAEQALRESEARFRKLAESTSSAIFIVQDSRIVYSNPAASRITGYDCDSLEGKYFWDLAHPTYRQILRSSSISENRAIQTPLQGRIVTRYELKLVTGSGQERWVDITLGSFEYKSKPALVVTGFDITERDIAEQALRSAKTELEQQISQISEALRIANSTLENELREQDKRRHEINRLRHENSHIMVVLEAVFNSVDDAVMVFDEDWVISHVNPIAENLFGAGLTGQRLEDILSLGNVRLENGELASAASFHFDGLKKGEVVQQKVFLSLSKEVDVEALALASPLQHNGERDAGAVLAWRLNAQTENADPHVVRS